MFPIGWMYYFGTNLEERFSVPDFWPSPESTHKIPFEREEIKAEVERLRAKRLAKRARRLQADGYGEEDDMQGGTMGVDDGRPKNQIVHWSLDRGAWHRVDAR